MQPNSRKNTGALKKSYPNMDENRHAPREMASMKGDDPFRCALVAH
jgi:hypothetical protein